MAIHHVILPMSIIVATIPVVEDPLTISLTIFHVALVLASIVVDFLNPLALWLG